MSLQDSLRTWVALDNQVRAATRQLQVLRENRARAERTALHEADSAGAMMARVETGDGYLRFGRVTTSSPLSLTYVRACLARCIPDPAQVDGIMKVIRESRVQKQEQTIRRTVQTGDE